MPKHHPRLENITLHFLALLLTFSSISLAFFSLITLDPNVTTNLKMRPILAYAPNDSLSWKQTTWSSSSSSVFTVTWGTNSNWTSYTSATGVSFGGSGITISPGGSIDSSIFNLGDQKLWIVIPDTGIDIFQRNALSASAVLSEAWQDSTTDVCNLNQTFAQYRLTNSTSNPITVGEITIFGWYLSIEGTVKSAVNNSPLSGVSVSYPESSAVSDSAGNYALESPYNGSTLSITASKEGYTPQTKTLSVSTDWCNSGYIENLDFSLSPISAGSNSAPTSTQNSPSTTNTVKIQSSLPTSGQPTSSANVVENFTVQTKDGSKIVFLEPIDLAANDVKNTLATLDNYIKLTSPNTISLDSQTIPSLNKKATITMYSLPFTTVPEILVNGQKDTQGVVSNINYDEKSGTLSFTVAHFTTFSAVPKLEVVTPKKIVTDANTVILGRISDPKAKVTGEFNGVKLAALTVSPTGEFSIKRLIFKEGSNTLKLKATSSIGTVLPLTTTFTYSPKAAKAEASQPDLRLVLIIALAFLFLGVLLGFVLLRRKLFHKKTSATTNSDASTPTQS